MGRLANIMDIKEPIKVVAVFDTDGMKPAKFKWKGRVYPVKEITYTWKSKEGAVTFIHFSVSDGSSMYELSYNKSTMGWLLESVE